MDTYTQETPILDFSHPSIQELFAERFAHLSGDVQMKAIYDFVRDEIVFGYNIRDDIPASEVLADGYGQCNTKATLFMALLRAAGVPCRIHGFTIHKRLQKGAITGIWYALAPQNILHSWVEVYLGERWINIEGFIIDKPYLRALQQKFPACTEGFCGYGVATDSFANPPIEWTGNDTYIQNLGINNDFGVYDSPDDFYTDRGINLASWKQFIFAHITRHAMNRAVERIRNGG